MNRMELRYCRKNKAMRYLLVLLICVGALSCKDDEEPGLADGTVIVKVDGQEYTTTDASANLDKNSSQVETDLRISARYAQGGFTISLRIASTNPSVAVDAGSFPVQGNNPTTPTGIVFYILDGALPHTSLEVPQPVVGSIVITQLDRTNKTVSGSFESVCAQGTDQKSLQGEFVRVPYVN